MKTSSFCPLARLRKLQNSRPVAVGFRLSPGAPSPVSAQCAGTALVFAHRPEQARGQCCVSWCGLASLFIPLYSAPSVPEANISALSDTQRHNNKSPDAGKTLGRIRERFRSPACPIKSQKLRLFGRGRGGGVRGGRCRGIMEGEKGVKQPVNEENQIFDVDKGLSSGLS